MICRYCATSLDVSVSQFRIISAWAEGIDLRQQVQGQLPLRTLLASLAKSEIWRWRFTETGVSRYLQIIYFYHLSQYKPFIWGYLL